MLLFFKIINFNEFKEFSKIFDFDFSIKYRDISRII